MKPMRRSEVAKENARGETKVLKSSGRRDRARNTRSKQLKSADTPGPRGALSPEDDSQGSEQLGSLPTD